MLRPDDLILEEAEGRSDELLEAVLSLAMPSLVTLVDQAVELLSQRCFTGSDASRQTQFRLRVALAEALANAIQCGNQNDPAKVVRIRADLFRDRIRVCVSDEGPGFNPAEVPDPRHPEQVQSPCGRGLFIIRNLAQEVEFNEKGNTIWMTLPRR